MKLKRVWWLGVVFLPALPFVVATKVNDWRLAKLESNFAALSHPSNSKHIARFSTIGNFGNGDHLDFAVAELRAKVTDGQVGAFYKNKTIPVPNSADDGYQQIKNGRQPLVITFLPSPLPANYQVKYGNGEGWNLNFAAGRKNLYLVEVWNSGENYSLNAMFDIRS